MSRREIIAYAITHAPKGVKGGPYEAPCGIGKAVPTLSMAWRKRDRAVVRMRLRAVRRNVPTARVIAIVRKVRPSEASAVDVLRELVAWGAHPSPGLLAIVDRARRVLASAGPDPMPVVRAAMRYLDHGPDGRLGPIWVAFREAGEVYREAVDAHRKAGGK